MNAPRSGTCPSNNNNISPISPDDVVDTIVIIADQLKLSIGEDLDLQGSFSVAGI
jgi:hypothetical protein